MARQEVGLNNLFHWTEHKYGTLSQLMVNDILPSRDIDGDTGY